MRRPADLHPFALPLPGQAELPASAAVAELLDRSLLQPISDLLSRPGKRFRARLVRIGAQLAAKPGGAPATRGLDQRCRLAGEIIEAIHAGALVIDDIQDGSALRRNAPTLHVRYGVPRAINAGNWLYFWPLARLRDLGLPARAELQAYRDCMATLAEAHCGQAIDVGTRIDELPQDQVPEVCQASLELKTGTLMALAMRLGGHAAGAGPDFMEAIDPLARQLGVALQRFDDAGNFALPPEPGGRAASKRHEDLYLRRPSWVWEFAAREHGARDYADFRNAVSKLPEESFLRFWVELHGFVPRLRKAAADHLGQVLSRFEERFGATHPEPVRELAGIANELEKAYG